MVSYPYCVLLREGRVVIIQLVAVAAKDGSGLQSHFDRTSLRYTAHNGELGHLTQPSANTSTAQQEGKKPSDHGLRLLRQFSRGVGVRCD